MCVCFFFAENAGLPVLEGLTFVLAVAGRGDTRQGQQRPNGVLRRRAPVPSQGVTTCALALVCRVSSVSSLPVPFCVDGVAARNDVAICYLLQSNVTVMLATSFRDVRRI